MRDGFSAKTDDCFLKQNLFRQPSGRWAYVSLQNVSQLNIHCEYSQFFNITISWKKKVCVFNSKMG